MRASMVDVFIYSLPIAVSCICEPSVDNMLVITMKHSVWDSLMILTSLQCMDVALRR